MALKVSGSIPGIYPINKKYMWFIEHSSILGRNYTTLKLICLLTRSSIVKNFFNTNLFLIRNVFFRKEKFSSSYRMFFKLGLTNSDFKTSKKNFVFSKNNLQFFIKLTSSVINKKLSIHHSYNSYFYKSSVNIGIININKIFSLWKNIIEFLKNIFYFNLKYLTFSNSYFKYETLSLNWGISRNLTHLWKYTNVFFFFISSKMTLSSEFYFKNLLSKGFRSAFVIDLYYHKNTLHFLNKFKFVTIGPVPLFSNLYTFYISLPVVSNSVFSNLFFLRLILKLKKLNSNLLWKNIKKSYK